MWRASISTSPKRWPKILGDETKVELKEVTSKTRIDMLKNGDIDIIIATMTITEERKEQVDFSDVYFEAGQSLLVKKGSPITGLESLNKDTKVLTVKAPRPRKISARKRPTRSFSNSRIIRMPSPRSKRDRGCPNDRQLHPARHAAAGPEL